MLEYVGVFWNMLDHFEVNATTVSRISSPENCLLHHCRFQTKQGTSMTSRRSVTFSSAISFLGDKTISLGPYLWWMASSFNPDFRRMDSKEVSYVQNLKASVIPTGLLLGGL